MNSKYYLTIQNNFFNLINMILLQIFIYKQNGRGFNEGERLITWRGGDLNEGEGVNIFSTHFQLQLCMLRTVRTKFV